MAKHTLLSASGAHRWLECTPSALLELQFPQTTSEYAEEGTAAHELCELTTRYFLGEVSEMDFENRRDELAKGPYYNAEMQECANDYARFVTEKTKAAQESCEDAFTELEVRVDFSKYVKDGFGTGDCIIVADKVLEIVDFKYGKGVRVEATGNPQMKLYALGALCGAGCVHCGVSADKGKARAQSLAKLRKASVYAAAETEARQGDDVREIHITPASAVLPDAPAPRSGFPRCGRSAGG